MANSIWATFDCTLPVVDPRNPHPKGYAIARLLHDHLCRMGLFPEKVENWRDAGYSVDFLIDHTHVYFFISHFGRVPQQWALCCTSDLSWVSRLLGKRDDEQRLKLARSIDAVLKECSEFTDIRWYRTWRGGENEPWTDAPPHTSENKRSVSSSKPRWPV